MQQFISQSTVITRKGQITLPASVRKALGVGQGDRITVMLEGQGARLVPQKQSVVEATAGIFKSDQPRLTIKEEEQAAEEAWAEEALKNL